MVEKKKVLVALSGGVDSSVSAALLLEQGYDVECAFITTWSVPWLPCTWREERRDAMRVAATLHIPFHTIDLSKEYEKNVVTYLIDEYRQGRTPNPDVMCNKHIKFGGFFDWAMKRGFDYVATGHYARVQEREGVFELLAGVDTNKDQTYFLWTLTQEHLAHTLFPIGQFEKPRVRELAEKYFLPTATKKDSQGICFLGKVNMKEFLSHLHLMV
jgi:tRNA-specific 2-thiouridylase